VVDTVRRGVFGFSARVFSSAAGSIASRCIPCGDARVGVGKLVFVPTIGHPRVGRIVCGVLLELVGGIAVLGMVTG
jgi:hypothetical protein